MSVFMIKITAWVYWSEMELHPAKRPIQSRTCPALLLFSGCLAGSAFVWSIYLELNIFLTNWAELHRRLHEESSVDRERCKTNFFYVCFWCLVSMSWMFSLIWIEPHLRSCGLNLVLNRVVESGVWSDQTPLVPNGRLEHYVFRRGFHLLITVNFIKIM